MSIIVLGTVALDTVKTPRGQRKEILGGSAVHFAMSARLFTKVNLVAIVGEDFPQKHIEFLRGKGVILTSLIKEKGRTFRWEGEYKGDLNSALTKSTELGVLSAFRPSVARHQRHIKYIFLANVDPDIQSHMLSSMREPKFVGLDSMNFWINTKRRSLLKLIKKVNIFVLNDSEARSLTGEHNLIKAAGRLISSGPPMVMIKKGEHGVIFKSKDLLFCLPAFPTEQVVDPTGAGDTFAGGFMGYLARQGSINNASVRRAISYATVMASFNVEGFGVERTRRLTLTEVNGRLKEFREFIKF
ncbi:MAG: PfkB family carbohydrate kinase [Candidatus Omnitrophica bacterium]|nr:PfkB family carbohydrate kinase [Candidatus Omnitrophota bacterium]